MGVSCHQDQVGSFALYFCCAVCTARLSSLANYRVQQLSVHKECYHVSLHIQTFGHLHAIAWIPFSQFFKAMFYFLLLVN
jgi:hypothetical protein